MSMSHNEVYPSSFSNLEADVVSALENAQIFDIESYGWLNADDPDPEFIGHAMWQTNSKYIDYLEVIGESPVSRRPTNEEKWILTLGEDLCGLMQASRLSLGLALVWAPRLKLNMLAPIENSFFWAQHMNAFLTLAIASDRLRDLLIVAITGSETKVFENRATTPKQKKENRWYVTPFKEAGQILSRRGVKTEHLKQAISDLPGEASYIYKRMKRRNSIVHEIAIRIAKHVCQNLLDLQAKYDDEQNKEFSPKGDDIGEWLLCSDSRVDEMGSEIDAAVKELCDWYLLLIKACSNVFQIEYWSRSAR